MPPYILSSSLPPCEISVSGLAKSVNKFKRRDAFYQIAAIFRQKFFRSMPASIESDQHISISRQNVVRHDPRVLLRGFVSAAFWGFDDNFNEILIVPIKRSKTRGILILVWNLNVELGASTRETGVAIR